MTQINDLISQIPISEVAAQLGVDEKTAQQAVEAAAPALVQGLSANAQDPAGAASLEKALGNHSGRGIASLAEVDQQDGAKIVRNVFGSNEQDVVNRLSGAQPALGGDLISKLLPLLAPIVLKWLANKWSNRGSSGSESSGSGSGGTSGGTGQAPKNFPTKEGSTTTTTQAQEPQSEGSSGGLGGLGDLFGQILGGGSSSQSGGLGGLGDLLGGLLGGGKR